MTGLSSTGIDSSPQDRLHGPHLPKCACHGRRPHDRNPPQLHVHLSTPSFPPHSCSQTWIPFLYSTERRKGALRGLGDTASGHVASGYDVSTLGQQSDCVVTVVRGRNHAKASLRLRHGFRRSLLFTVACSLACETVVVERLPGRQTCHPEIIARVGCDYASVQTIYRPANQLCP